MVLCADNGSSWSVIENCSSGQYCEGGECVALACSPDEQWCVGDVFFSCASDGRVISEEEDCGAAGLLCTELGCQEFLCNPGTLQCADNLVEKCADDGMSFVSAADCAYQNMSCVDGACSPVCGDEMCSDFEDCETCSVDCGPCTVCENCTEFETCGKQDGVCVAKMAQIPAGDFWMGCNAIPSDLCHPVDTPVHPVFLSSYAIDVTEVTAAQYQHCVDFGGCSGVLDGSCISSPMKTNLGKPGMENHPMNCATFQRAQDYCQWAGKRLCTEAEWEKAARGGCEFYASCEFEAPPYPWGSQGPSCSLAVYGSCSQNWTAEVGTHPQGLSPYGAYDMAGNVKELTSDWFATDYYCMGQDADVDDSDGTTLCPPGAAPADGLESDPVGPFDGIKKVVRGGAYDDVEPMTLLTYRRVGWDPAKSTARVGFRCCADL